MVQSTCLVLTGESTMTILVPSLWAAAIALLSLGDFPSTGLRIIALTCLLTKE